MVTVDPISFGGPSDHAPDGATGAGLEARRAARRAEALSEEIAALREQVASLHALTLAIWGAAKPLLEERGDAQPLQDAVEARLAAYDQLLRNEPAPCPGCGRPLAARATQCLYCGARKG